LKNLVRNVYAWSLGAAALFGIWYYALVGFWPWHAESQWQDHFVVPALCAAELPTSQPEECTLRFKELGAALRSGKVVSLVNIPTFGDLSDTESWHHWQKVEGKAWDFEASWSSWDFKESIRYRIEGESKDTLVLVEYRNVGPRLIPHATVLMLLSLILIVIKRRFH
jgi:hypothetical protein